MGRRVEREEAGGGAQDKSGIIGKRAVEIEVLLLTGVQALGRGGKRGRSGGWSVRAER